MSEPTPARAPSTDVLALGGVVLITVVDAGLAAFTHFSIATLGGLSAPVITGLFAIIRGRADG